MVESNGVVEGNEFASQGEDLATMCKIKEVLRRLQHNNNKRPFTNPFSLLKSKKKSLKNKHW